MVETMRAMEEAQSDASTAHELFAEASGAERELAREEVEQAAARMSGLDEKLRALLLPKDPNDGRNVIVEIRGAEGGEEANLFAKDLFEMYERYADRPRLARRGPRPAELRSRRDRLGHFRREG